MLETTAPKTMQDHYDRAHCLRARAFADLFSSIAALFHRTEKGPRQMAQPQSC